MTDATWKAKCVFHGPVGGDVANPTVRTEPLPDGWSGRVWNPLWLRAAATAAGGVGFDSPYHCEYGFVSPSCPPPSRSLSGRRRDSRHGPCPDFDDSTWANATEWSEERIQPKQPYFEHDFKGTKWIWTADLDLDNTVLFRKKVVGPGGKPRWTTRPDLVPAAPAID